MKERIHTPRVVLGLVLTFVGVFLTLDNLGWLDHGLRLFDFWPVFLIGTGVSKALNRDWIRGLFWILLGSAFLLAKLHPEIDVQDIIDRWPLILIFIGLSVLFSRERSSKAKRQQAHTGMSILRSVKAETASEAYTGDGLTALVGGYSLDLTDARLAPGGAVVDVFAFWGGIELRVPADWSVDLQVVPVMGVAEDKTHAPVAESGAPRLVVRGFVLMGGVEVQN